MPVVDADAHVMEGPQTWEYCDPSERQYMPILVNPGPEGGDLFLLECFTLLLRRHARPILAEDGVHEDRRARFAGGDDGVVFAALANEGEGVV